MFRGLSFLLHFTSILPYWVAFRLNNPGIELKKTLSFIILRKYVSSWHIPTPRMIFVSFNCKILLCVSVKRLLILSRICICPWHFSGVPSLRNFSSLFLHQNYHSFYRLSNAIIHMVIILCKSSDFSDLPWSVASLSSKGVSRCREGLSWLMVTWHSGGSENLIN